MQALSFGIFWLKIKKIQEKNKLAPEGIDGMFCQELKTVLKQTIDVWNEYHEGTKVFEDLVKEKERAISKMFTFIRLQKDFGRLSTSSGWIARKGERWEEIDSMV